MVYIERATYKRVEQQVSSKYDDDNDSDDSDHSDDDDGVQISNKY